MLQKIVLLMTVSTLVFGSLTTLTPQEQKEIDARLERFYSADRPASVMNEPTKKYGVHTGKREFPNQFLRTENASYAHPLLEQAQRKGTQEFQKHYCNSFLSKQFPDLHCENPALREESWSTIQSDDQVENLSYTWTDTTHNLEQIPVAGKIDRDAWSDDYWRTRWGLSSFRYSQYNPSHEFKTYKEAVASYAQPSQWNSLSGVPLQDLAQQVLLWSPSEKYDLMTGDRRFTLTNEQKGEGMSSLGPDGNVEDWMGICHGWAPAALMVDRPKKPATVVGANGVPVTWYPNDIKALTTLAWANGNFTTNQAGGRCDVKKTATFPNGRLKQQECFDTNPATFHLILGNMIGRAKVGFVFDKTFDYEVWNQPVVSYEFTYFNPLSPNKRSRNFKEVMVPYDMAFKQHDRFQKPLTRGNTLQPGNNQDARIRNVVGVIATVVYLSEITPEHGPVVQADQLLRETYTYDIELEQRGQGLVATGGEWHNNAHPDFLWVAQRDSVPHQDADFTALNFNGNEIPSPLVSETAARASQNAYPLCQVLKNLIKRSTGTDSYRCD